LRKIILSVCLCLAVSSANAGVLDCRLDTSATEQMAKVMGSAPLVAKAIVVDSTEMQTSVLITLSEPIFEGFSKLSYDLIGIEAESIATVGSDDTSLTLSLLLGEEQVWIHIFDTSDKIKAVGAYSCQ
jgi:hypothetical protein